MTKEQPKKAQFPFGLVSEDAKNAWKDFAQWRKWPYSTVSVAVLGSILALIVFSITPAAYGSSFARWVCRLIFAGFFVVMIAFFQFYLARVSPSRLMRVFGGVCALTTAFLFFVLVDRMVPGKRPANEFIEAEFSDEDIDRRPPAAKPASFRNSGRRFEQLTAKNQDFVRENYKSLLQAHEKKDFREMRECASRILSLVDEYNDTRSYETIAKRGIDYLEEAARQKAREEKMAANRAEAAALEKEGVRLFEAALSDPVKRRQFLDLTSQIFAKDPSNQMATDWKNRILEKDAKEERKKLSRELASLEIRGQKLVKRATNDVEARAELYEIIRDIQARDINNEYPNVWRQRLHP